VILEHAHIGSQRSISILDLAQRVVEMTRSESGLRYVPYEEARREEARSGASAASAARTASE
jgi:hypothetical protein